MNKSKTIELDKILPEDVINVIDDIVTHLMADELHPAKKEEPTIEEITEALTANGIHRNLCIMGGEPMCAENQFLTLLVIKTIKERLPDTKVYLWTGYTLDELLNTTVGSKTKAILDFIIQLW